MFATLDSSTFSRSLAIEEDSKKKLLRSYDVKSSIFIKVLDGKTVTLPFDLICTVGQYQEEIERRTHIPLGEQRLLFAGKQLRGEDRLIDYGIHPDSTIHLTAKLFGGKPHYKLLVVSLIAIALLGALASSLTLIIKECTAHNFSNTTNSKTKCYFGYGILAGTIIATSCCSFFFTYLKHRYMLEGSNINHLIKLPFADMDINKEMRITLTNDRLPWEIVKPGLNLRGKCENKTCEAYEKFVWIPKGFGTFNLNKESKISFCPMPQCQKVAIQVDNLGMCKCFFSLEGSFRGENNEPIAISREERCISDEPLLTFEDSEGSRKEWYYLNIHVKPLVNRDEVSALLNTKEDKNFCSACW